jgi:hypothetical protein
MKGKRTKRLKSKKRKQKKRGILPKKGEKRPKWEKKANWVRNRRLREVKMKIKIKTQKNEKIRRT